MLYMRAVFDPEMRGTDRPHPAKDQSGGLAQPIPSELVPLSVESEQRPHFFKRPYRLSSMTGKLAAALLIAVGLFPYSAAAQSASLEGSWSGGGPVTFATGAREQARCRAHYRRRSNDGYVVKTICATASARAEQTTTLHKIADNRYTGNFYNSDYGISGTVYVIVRGNTQSVKVLSSAGSASLTFSR